MIEEDYKQNKDDGPCSIKYSPIPGFDVMWWHKSCSCDNMAVDKCKKACDSDKNCKGFVQRVKEISPGCDYATTSNDCIDGSDINVLGDYVGDLLPIGSGDRGFCGCWRKVIPIWSLIFKSLVGFSSSKKVDILLLIFSFLF